MNDTANTFDIEAYMSAGVENVIKGIIKTSFFCPEQTAFMAKFALAAKKAQAKRREYNDSGTHIPPFLIASITSVCNLHCAGCYARSLSTCTDDAPVSQLSASDWSANFKEASALGISFILLAGGEPLVRKDVIEQAALFPDILFPIFTNGTLLTDEYMKLIDRHRNLIPILSIEGGPEKTNLRRGSGIYEFVSNAMSNMKKKHIAFGASITVTSENLKEVMSDDFINGLMKQGCRAVIYVEYVPVSEETMQLAPDDSDRDYFNGRLLEIRKKYDDTLFIAFPGDEKNSDGCLAAGRGFFHINSTGGAEPCPFSPYSDINIKNTSLLDAINSKLFTALRDGDILKEDHKGGCVLFERRQLVEKLLKDGSDKL
ncbi:MAG: radical SAM protein [Lachnospiraceae bacterium]|nr:radical SAM protein [Lachnospiraceae bacterium]